jgi:hypothetical protein
VAAGVSPTITPQSLSPTDAINEVRKKYPQGVSLQKKKYINKILAEWVRFMASVAHIDCRVDVRLIVESMSVRMERGCEGDEIVIDMLEDGRYEGIM